MDRRFGSFIWDPKKEAENIAKHSETESRLFCIGKVDGRIITVRFTYRYGLIRIYGAGYWRKGRAYYESQDA